MATTVNKKKNIVVIVPAIFLFLALFDGWPYGFFTFLRFVVFAATIYVAWMAYQQQKEKWTWIFGFLAALFNPFIQVYLSRGTWVIIDLFVALFLISSIFLLKFDKKQKISV